MQYILSEEEYSGLTPKIYLEEAESLIAKMARRIVSEDECDARWYCTDGTKEGQCPLEPLALSYKISYGERYNPICPRNRKYPK